MLTALNNAKVFALISHFFIFEQDRPSIRVTIIEVNPHRGGWRVFEAPGVEMEGNGGQASFF
jgi:hypothetical protein